MRPQHLHSLCLRFDLGGKDAANKTKDKLPTGELKIEVETSYLERNPAGPLRVVMKVNGREVASGVVPVGLEYYGEALFKFKGKIGGARVEYLGTPAQLQKEKLQTDGAIPAAD